MKHVLKGSKEAPCLHACDDIVHCIVCDGGLALCVVCGGAEVTLPVDCPGVRMTEDQMERVGEGKLDFCGSSWIVNGQGVSGSSCVL